MSTIQTSFTGKMDRTREVLSRLEQQHGDIDTVNLAVSGGTDSVVAAHVFSQLAAEYGFEPNAVTHINTGAGIPQSQLVAEITAEMLGVEYIQNNYRNPQDSLAARILENGWPGAYGGSPAAGGHGLEWANRKDKPMNEVYMMFEGQQIWVSGARKLESKKRQGNVPDNSIERDKPRRVWVSPIGGWTSQDKREYILEHELPVSEAYLILGMSGECVACAYDDASLLTDIQLLSPELAFALSSMALWLGMRAVRGDVDIGPKRLCWGWEPQEKPSFELESLTQDSDAQEWVGCSAESCAEREIPNWVLELNDTQIVDRQDVKEAWENGVESVAQRFKA